jgi:hypothetical protein
VITSLNNLNHFNLCKETHCFLSVGAEFFNTMLMNRMLEMVSKCALRTEREKCNVRVQTAPYRDMQVTAPTNIHEFPSLDQ